jgi:hypothetical protein
VESDAGAEGKFQAESDRERAKGREGSQEAGRQEAGRQEAGRQEARDALVTPGPEPQAKARILMLNPEP